MSSSPTCLVCFIGFMGRNKVYHLEGCVFWLFFRQLLLTKSIFGLDNQIGLISGMSFKSDFTVGTASRFYKSKYLRKEKRKLFTGLHIP